MLSLAPFANRGIFLPNVTQAITNKQKGREGKGEGYFVFCFQYIP